MVLSEVGGANTSAVGELLLLSAPPPAAVFAPARLTSVAPSSAPSVIADTAASATGAGAPVVDDMSLPKPAWNAAVAKGEVMGIMLSAAMLLALSAVTAASVAVTALLVAALGLGTTTPASEGMTVRCDIFPGVAVVVVVTVAVMVVDNVEAELHLII